MNRKEKLLKDVNEIISNESENSYFPELAIINLCTTLGAICSFLDNKDFYEFEESCVFAYEKEYIGDTQITDKKHLSLIFDFIERYDEHKTFDLMNKIKLKVEGENYSFSELSDVFLCNTAKYCSNIKLSLVSFKNIYSIIYQKVSLMQNMTFTEACDQSVSAGKKLIDKLTLTIQRNISKSNEIKIQLREAINSVISKEEFASNSPLLDRLFVLITLAAICTDFAGFASSDFIKICQTSYSTMSVTPLDKFCSDAQYLDYTYEPPNAKLLYKMTLALSNVLKSTYNTNRMIDMSYALIDLAVELSDEHTLGKFLFLKYGLTVFDHRPITANVQRECFNQSLDDLTDMLYNNSKNSIIEVSQDERAIDPALMN
ncbi:MAG: hypothetical protein WC679_13710 [Bacteroidales bacterium]|jgi:hypothetical protein